VDFDFGKSRRVGYRWNETKDLDRVDGDFYASKLSVRRVLQESIVI
jgi:hypothetical protein